MVKYLLIILFIYTPITFAVDFVPIDEQSLKSSGNAMIGAYNLSQDKLDAALSYRRDVLKHANDCNTLYNYARRVYALARTGIYKLKEAGAMSSVIYQLAGESERGYKAAISLCDNHGRAHIMLGVLLSELWRAEEANAHLRRGITLPEGSRDWMIAVNQYLFNQINLKSIGANEKVLYQKFKKHTDTHTAYKARVNMYAPYIPMT